MALKHVFESSWKQRQQQLVVLFSALACVVTVTADLQKTTFINCSNQELDWLFSSNIAYVVGIKI